MSDKDLKDKYASVTKWLPQFRQAQAQVMAEEAVLVPLDRMAAHCYLESRGKPNAASGVNEDRCTDPGVSCAADGRAHGLFQIWWPPFRVDWNRINDPLYNSYCGAKTLALRYKKCGHNWRAASMAFFAGSCVDIGTIDVNTGTDQAEYDEALRQYIKELNSIGIGSGQDNSDPKVPTKDGDGNTTTDNETCLSILGQNVCIPLPNFGSIASDFITSSFPRIVLFIIGIGVLIIGLRAIV